MTLIQSTGSKTLARIVADDYRAAQVFEQFGLDYCCKGKRELALACQEKGIQQAEVITELEALATDQNNTQRFNTWSVEFLTDYIVLQHHSYVRTMIPLIQLHLQKVVNAHAEKHPEVIEIQSSFENMSPVLLNHLSEEETAVFPRIKLVAISNQLNVNDVPIENELKSYLENLDVEHHEVGDVLHKIQTLTNNFTPPPGACTTFRVLYQELKAFQEDMFKHIHLENNILFPKVAAMFKDQNQNSTLNN